MSSSSNKNTNSAQSETLLIYGIFLFLIGLGQIGISIGYRYLFIGPGVIDDKYYYHWFVYPEWSAALTIVPFLCSITYAIFKRRVMTILVCFGSFICFLSSSVYIGLLIVHTIEYWQTASSPNGGKVANNLNIKPFLLIREPTFESFAFLLILTLALVQSLLSIIGGVISFVWAPCCSPSISSFSNHKHEAVQSSSLRSSKRQQHQQHSHYGDGQRFITPNNTNHPNSDSMMNGFLHHSQPPACSPMRTHYDEV